MLKKWVITCAAIVSASVTLGANAQELPIDTAAANTKHPAILFETAQDKTDKAFIEMATRGAERASKEFGIKFDQYTIGATEDREAKLHQIADSGASPIIAVGFENVAPVMHLADHYPATHFVVIDGMVPPSFHNVQSLIFKDQEGAFLVGMIAAQTSKTGVIGFVGGMDVPLIRNFAYGYEQGAHYMRKDIKVVRMMIGDTRAAWSDPGKGAALAEAEMTQGADVIFAAAGGSGLGVLSAVSQKAEKYSIGVDTNQNGLYPGTVLTSMVKRVDLAVLDTLKASQNNDEWQPGIKYLSATDGYLDYAVDNNNRKLLSKSLIEKLENVKDLISRGAIRVEGYSPN